MKPQGANKDLPSLSLATPAQARSRLAPYLSSMTTARLKGFSYRQIAEALQADAKLKVDAAEVRRYLQRHATQALIEPLEVPQAPPGVMPAPVKAEAPPAIDRDQIIDPAQKRKAADEFAQGFETPAVKSPLIKKLNK